MTDTLPQHEDLEQAFDGVKKIVGRLPANTERREAERLLDVAADLAHEARERPADRS